MVVHQKHQQCAPSAGDLQAPADFVAKHRRTVDVFAHVLGTTGVVHDHREIERVGIADIQQQTTIKFAARRFINEQCVELVDAAQGVLVGGVAVEKLMLHKAVHGIEFGEEFSEKSHPVHEPQCACDIALALEDCLKRVAVPLVITKILVHQVEVFLDQFSHRRREFQRSHLAMLEQPHQAVGVAREHIVGQRVDAPVARRESVELLNFALAEREKRTKSRRGRLFLLNLVNFHQRRGVLPQVPGVRVVVAHERLGATQDALLRIIERGGNEALKAQGEDVVLLAGFVVEFVSDAMKKIVGVGDFPVGCRGQALFLDQILEVGDAAFHPGYPHDVVIVAQTAAGFLDVRFLKKRGFPVSVVPGALVLTSQFEKFLLLFSNALLFKKTAVLLIQFRITGNHPGVHHGGFALLIEICLGDALGNRPHRMANLQADIPEYV